MTVFGVTNFLTLVRSPVLQASNNSLRGSAAPDPVRDSGFVSTDRRPAISHRHFHATVMPRLFRGNTGFTTQRSSRECVSLCRSLGLPSRLSLSTCRRSPTRADNIYTDLRDTVAVVANARSALTRDCSSLTGPKRLLTSPAVDAALATAAV